MSDAHTRFGAADVKFLASQFLVTGRPCFEAVVTL